ncbi:MAG: MopE-related protein [Myxococcota bacterium]
MTLFALLLACSGESAKPTDTAAPEDTAILPVDEDGDGFLVSEGDCDDADAAVNPDAVETCNEVDDNCDGATDEALTTPFWVDADADGHGDADLPVLACDVPAGAVTNHDDCDDADAAIHPGAAETDCLDPVDYNCDGASGSTDADGDGHPACTECDDTDPAVSPDAAEACNTVDDDCDGEIDEAGATGEGSWHADGDADGYGDPAATTLACDSVEGFVADATDCDDTDGAVSPAGTETCDGADQDCDGTADEGATGDAVWFYDGDGDSYGNPAVTSAACDAPAGYVADATDCNDGAALASPAGVETCDGIDNDCDGATDESGGGLSFFADADGDGYGDPAASTTSCTAPAGYVTNDDDCDDRSSSYAPDASEVCGDSLDQDCDGSADDGCAETIEHCGTISADETWSGDDIHYVTCDVTVQGASAPLLTIEDGAVVEFAPGTGLVVGASSYGELWVDGHTAGVIFTSDDTRPGAGDWDGISIGGYDRGTWIEGATITYGGANGYGNVYAANTTLLTIVDSVVTDSSNSGVYLNNAKLDVSGTTVSNNEDQGIYLTTNADLSTSGGPTFTGNTLQGNGSYPLVVPSEYVGEIDSTNTFAGNDDDYVYVYAGSVTEDTTWYGLDVPYYIAGDVTFGVAAGMDMTIADGAELHFASGVALNIGTGGYVDFRVEGTTRGVTFTSSRSTPRPGDWDGLNFGAYVQLADIDGATIAYGGANLYGNIYVYNNPAVIQLTNSAITHSSTSGVYLAWMGNFALHDSALTDNADFGLYAYDNGTLDGDLAFTGNVVTRNDIGLSLPAQEAGGLGADGTYAGNVSDNVELRADAINYSMTMRNLDVPYHVTGDMQVGNVTWRPTLTIEDGAELQFDSSAGLLIGSGGTAYLDVQGGALGVLFTSAAPVPAKGDWDGITVGWYNVSSTIEGATIEYAGDNGYANLLFTYSSVTGGTASVRDCVIREGSESGIWASYANDIAISDTTVEDNADYGVYFDTTSSLSTTAEPTFTGNTITGNGLYPLVLDAISLDQIGASSSFTGNGVDRVFVNADLVTESGTWQALDVPYYMNGDTRIEAATTPIVIVEPGTTFLFNYYASLSTGLYNYGELRAVGTLAEPIVFTSSQFSPHPGDWDGLTLGTYDAGSALQYIEVAYGGENARGNIFLYNNASVVTISDALVSYSETYGIYRTASASAVIADITYLENTSGTFYAP